MLKLQEKTVLLLPSVPSPQPQAKLLMPTLVVLMALELLVATVAAVPVALPGCPEACGSVTVPYPFGFRQGCFHTGFNLTCDETRKPPKLLLGDGVEVDDISLADGTVRIQSKIVDGEWSENLTALAGNRNGIAKPSLNSNGSWSGGMTGQRLAVSTEHNVLVAIGCNFVGYLTAGPDTGGSAGRSEYVSACAALCDRGFPPPGDTSCSGVGCCRTTIAQGLPAYGVQFRDLDQNDGGPYVEERRPLGSVFIVDREWFSGINVGVMQNNTFGDFGSYYGYPGHRRTSSTPKVTSVPTALEWSLDVKSDRDLVVLDPHSVSGWRCMSLNSFAANIDGAVNKVRCNCSDGYEGNPYIINGCQDIDECQQPVYPCMHGTCINMLGTYRCATKKRIISLQINLRSFSGEGTGELEASPWEL